MVDKSDSRKPDKKGFPLPKAMIVKIRRNTEEDKEEKMPVETDSKLDTAKRTSKQS